MSDTPMLVLSEELVSKTRHIVERRRQIEALLKKAEDSRSEVKPDIYQRVTADYNSRLADLAAEYHPLRDEMVSNLERIRSEESRLRNILEGINDLLEELRFRARLGEFSDDELQLKEKESKGEASEIESLIATIEDSFATAGDLLGPDIDKIAATTEAEQQFKPNHEPEAEPMPDVVESGPEQEPVSMSPAGGQLDESGSDSQEATPDEPVAPATPEPANAEQSDPPLLEELASQADLAKTQSIAEDPILPDAKLGSDTVFLGKPFAVQPPAADQGNAELRAAVLKSSKADGKEWQVQPQGLVLGRSDSCDVKIEGKTVSRHHAIIHVADGNFLIEDVSSGGGVEVNRKRVDKKQSLSSGDRIQVALAVFTFVIS